MSTVSPWDRKGLYSKQEDLFEKSLIAFKLSETQVITTLQCIANAMIRIAKIVPQSLIIVFKLNSLNHQLTKHSIFSLYLPNLIMIHAQTGSFCSSPKSPSLMRQTHTLWKVCKPYEHQIPFCHLLVYLLAPGHIPALPKLTLYHHFHASLTTRHRGQMMGFDSSTKN